MFSVCRLWFRIEGSAFDIQGNWGLGLRAQDVSRLQGLDFSFQSVHIRFGVEGSSSGESKSRRSYNHFSEQNFPLESALVFSFSTERAPRRSRWRLQIRDPAFFRFRMLGTVLLKKGDGGGNNSISGERTATFLGP